jgi:hypothetical protein
VPPGAGGVGEVAGGEAPRPARTERPDFERLGAALEVLASSDGTRSTEPGGGQVPTMPRLTALDRLAEEDRRAKQIFLAITDETMKRIEANHCAAGVCAEQLIDVTVDIKATETRVEGRNASFTVVRGAPISESMRLCLQRAFAPPIVRRGRGFVSFEGEGRGRFLLARCDRPDAGGHPSP